MKLKSPKTRLTVFIASLMTITTFTHANQNSEIEQLRAEVNELRQMLQAQQARPVTSVQVPYVSTASVGAPAEKIIKLYSNGKQNSVPMLICMVLFVLILHISLKTRKVCSTALIMCY